MIYCFLGFSWIYFEILFDEIFENKNSENGDLVIYVAQMCDFDK